MPSIHPQSQTETELGSPTLFPYPRPLRCAASTHAKQQQQGFCNQNNFFSSFLASSAAHRGKMAPEEHAWRGRGVAAPCSGASPCPALVSVLVSGTPRWRGWVGVWFTSRGHVTQAGQQGGSGRRCRLGCAAATAGRRDPGLGNAPRGGFFFFSFLAKSWLLGRLMGDG